MSDDLSGAAEAPASQGAALGRRGFLALAIASLLGAELLVEGCGRPGHRPRPARVVRRAVRRRTRRRIRRRVLWRMVGPRRVIVVPRDIDGDDELELEDGRAVKVIEVHGDNNKVVVVDDDGNEETLDAQFEGEVGENPKD